MRIKTLLAAAAITALTGSAIAQSTSAVGTGPTQGEPAQAQWGSAEEERMFQERAETWGGFFTDETYSELVPEDDFRAYWDGMSAEDQADARDVCEQVGGAPTNYRNTTIQMCQNMGLI